jgi:hypothetical protein
MFFTVARRDFIQRHTVASVGNRCKSGNVSRVRVASRDGEPQGSFDGTD